MASESSHRGFRPEAPGHPRRRGAVVPRRVPACEYRSARRRDSRCVWAYSSSRCRRRWGGSRISDPVPARDHTRRLRRCQRPRVGSNHDREFRWTSRQRGRRGRGFSARHSRHLHADRTRPRLPRTRCRSCSGRVADPLRGLELIAAAPPDRPDPGSHDRSGRRSRCDTVAAYASRIAVVPNLVASGSTRETSTSDSQPESSAVDPLEGPLRSSAGGRTRDRPSQKATTASQSRRKAVRHC